MLVDTPSLIGAVIQAIHTAVCEPVHPAWVDELTTPIATSMAVLQFADGRFFLVAPREVKLDPAKYPSLGLEITECTESALRWNGTNGKAYSMSQLAAASEVLPFVVASSSGSDPLGEGATSEVLLSGTTGASIVLRHIYPPMTLGLAFAQNSQAPNFSSKPTC